ncbi:MAG: aminotransferase class V-fold PLP-dependent enzyme [Mycobacteriales bacterium]
MPLVGGADVEYANLDYAASAPCLTAVKEVVDRLLPQYASVHRGTGHLSRVCTVAYEEARRSVRRFVGARARSAVIFTRNTTDAMNLLAHVAPRGTTVITFDTEHHATLLAWRGLRVVHLAPPRSAEAACAAVDEALRWAPVGPRLLAVTGASNVTGEVWPLRALARIAHSRGARIAVDAAQLAPHARIDAAADDLDYVALSAHKLYAPFGAGALVGRADWLQAAPPYLIGGGATVAVTADRVRWADVPDRHEAGSPNVVGAVALAAACDAIAATDRAAVEAREARLLARLRAGLAAIDGVDRLSLWGPDAAAIGLVSFVADGIDGQKLAAILSAEHGIGVRAGGFCAHRFVRHLVGATRPRSSVAEVVPVRASIGLGTTQEHVDRLVAAVRSVLRNGPRWTYAVHDGEWVPAPDPRPVELPW